MIDNECIKRLIKFFESVKQSRELTNEEESLLLELKGSVGTFIVSCITRDDINAVGFNGDGVDDDTMERIASKMGDSYCESGYWDDLKIHAEYNNVEPLGYEVGDEDYGDWIGDYEG